MNDYLVGQILCVMAKKTYIISQDDYDNYNLQFIAIRAKHLNENQFNDVMHVIWKYQGYWNDVMFPVTTIPGNYWLENPDNPKGTAIVKPGQYKDMWSYGLHLGEYPALVQTGLCTVWRDCNKDDHIDVGVIEDTGIFGINFHHAITDTDTIDQKSAGCIVTRHTSDHDKIMTMINKQKSYTFTLLEERDFDSLDS